ncbi:MAG: FeoA family protein [Candidatus Krumholzibacteriia bacterium]
MPLSMVRQGTRARLREVRAGRGLRGRLAAMGLVPGCEIEVLRNSGRGPFIVAVRDARIVLGRGMAMKIEVD